MTEIESLEPAGVFTPKTLDADLVLFAGGSGITPVLSILKSALAVGTGQVVLVYANQHENAVMFAAQLRELAAAHPDRLHVVHWLESVQGLPSRAQLRALAAPFTSYTAFVCGPSPFMESVGHVLRELGVPPARIHVERFQSLAADPFVTPVETVVEVADGADCAELEVELDGETHTLAWPRNRKLLDFLLEQGLRRRSRAGRERAARVPASWPRARSRCSTTRSSSRTTWTRDSSWAASRCRSATGWRSATAADSG